MDRYSEQEIQAIFRRAAERQQTTDSGTPRNGLTLEELKAIGDESGIDPAHIEAAARDIEQGRVHQSQPTGIERLYGMSASVHAERVLPGRMDDTTWGHALDTLRSVFNTRGQAEAIGPIREWSAFTSSGFDYQALFDDDTVTILEGLNLTNNNSVHVEAKPEDDDMRLTATYRIPNSRLWEGPGMAAVFLLAAIVMTVVFALNASPLALFLVPLGLLLGGGGAAAYYYHMHRNELETAQQRIDKAMERIAYLHAEHRDADARQNTVGEKAETAPSTSPELRWDERNDASSSASSTQAQPRRQERT